MPFALTRWVRRLLVVTSGVYLLQLTVFTSPWFVETFGFAPDLLRRHPWSPLTYAFLHGSFLHLLFNMLALFMFGPPVEGRLGGARFIRLYVIAALGGAALSLAFAALTGDGVIIGASAAVFGVMLAFVLEWPDAPVLVFPLPVPIRAKWLVAFFAVMSLGAGIAVGVFGMRSNVAHLAHLGGFGAALLYLRGADLLRLPRRRSPRSEGSAVLVHPSAAAARRAAPSGQQAHHGADAATLAEVDRVLDKISVGGLASLTPEERRFLDAMSRRFQQEN
jgi:membrane associated rhomboid family serine protease